MVFKADRNGKNQRLSYLRIFWPIACLFWIAVWVLLQTDVKKASVQFFQPDYFTAEESIVQPLLSSSYFLVNTKGCRIPKMDPFDPSIMQYVITGDGWNGTEDEDDGERPIKCSPPSQMPYLSPLVSSNLTHIFLDRNSIIERNMTSSPPDCCYEPFWRIDFNVSTSEAEDIRGVDSQYKTGGKCIEFGSSESAFMGENEFVKVECYTAGSNKTERIYKDFFSFTPMKRKVADFNITDKDRWSVLIFGVDAVSRLNLYRQMPKTLAYIKDRLKAVEMYGYNKVADNTFPNLVPVLAGMTVNELKTTGCWPEQNSYFDDCPFLWKYFEEAGYRTLFAEDASWMGIFSYMKSGFFKQPTDYYWKAFNSRAESEIGSEKRLNAHLCTGYRTTLQTLLDYGKKFSITMTMKINRPYFGLIWGASMSHDYLNLPRYGDEDHLNFFRDLHEAGAFNNCVLVFMSDHGLRWGGIRSTYQGHLEERLPFLFFALPDTFKEKYATAVGYLHANSRRLTTPFDVHETLVDVLHSNPRLSNEILKRRIDGFSESSAAEPAIDTTTTTRKRTRRGISMFLPIPKERTCDDAEIPNHWCTCHRAAAISIGDGDVIKAADNLVEHINKLLKAEVKRCAFLKRERIISARVEETPARNENESDDERQKRSEWLRDYIITVETKPGRGNFEATIRRNLDGTYKTMGTVSRTNVYGNQSACIGNYRLKLYCYCLKHIQ